MAAGRIGSNAKPSGGSRRPVHPVVRWAISVIVGMVPLLVGIAASSQPAGAVSVGPFSIEPARTPGALFGRPDFNYDVVPGQRIHDAVVLSNTTSAPEDFRVWAADAYNTAVGGGFAIRPMTWVNHGVGAWIQLPLSRDSIYQLPGNTAVTLNLTLTIPPDATPGVHAGGIVALEIPPGTSPRGYGHVNVHLGVATAVFVHVQGAAKAGAALGGVQVQASVPPLAFVSGSSEAHVSFQLENTGNTVLNGMARATVTNIFGQTVKVFPAVPVNDFLPGQHFTIKEPTWRPLPVVGPEQLRVAFDSRGLDPVIGSSSFWIVPWLLVLIFALAVIMLVLGVWWRGRDRHQEDHGGTGIPGMPAPDPGAGGPPAPAPAGLPGPGDQDLVVSGPAVGPAS